MTNRPYRIAVVIPKYGLVGGGERYASEVTERLAANPRYDVHVIANQWRGISPNITFHRVPVITFPRFLVTPSFAYFANRLIAKMGFDLVHTHDRIFRADLFTMHGIPHRTWVSEVRQKRMSLFDYATAWVEEQMVHAGGCRMFLAVSELAGDRFSRMFPAVAKQVEILSPGVAMERFPVGEGKNSIRRKIREHYGIGFSEPVILFVAMNYELKGLDLIIEALAKIVHGDTVNQRPRLLVVGKGSQRKYSQLASNMGIGENVIFAGVVENAIEDIYAAADLFIMLSGFDTFGMVVLEAMAASLPVIVSDRVGARDLVDEGVNGYVVDRYDVGTVCDRIQFLLDSENRERFGRAARKEAENHSWDQVTKRLDDIYSVLLQRN
ncbi:MAG: glycosyltransferase family 4 protein [Desulfobulbaceae bacterium]|nr:glycosyltransferase family 4 protein [Desulfobulbaceae bacterium]